MKKKNGEKLTENKSGARLKTGRNTTRDDTTKHHYIDIDGVEAPVRG